MTCNRCFDPLENKRGPCVFKVYNPVPDPIVPEKEEVSMAKGLHFVMDGKVFRTTTPEAKRLLKQVIKGEPAVPRTEDEIAPVIDLGKLTKETAWEEFKKIEVGE